MISNEEMDDVMKIIKPTGNSALLVKRFTKIIKNETK